MGALRSYTPLARACVHIFVLIALMSGRVSRLNPFSRARVQYFLKRLTFISRRRIFIRTLVVVIIIIVVG